MIHYGLEYEFFITGDKGLVVPAFLATNQLDGNPLIGELRTGVYPDLTDCVFELQKLIHKEREYIESKGYKMFLVDKATFTMEQIKSLRANEVFADRKDRRALKELSIYGKGTGKILPKGVYKASLQINVSNNVTKKLLECKRYAGDGNYHPAESEYTHGEVFDYVSIIRKWDQQFAKEIKLAGRVPGVYAIKMGVKGQRIEYRSLPTSIAFLDLLK